MKIILADDEQMLRLGMISMIEELEPRGITILQARNGKELLEIAQQEHPEIAYIDIKMPVMDGLEAFRQLKNISPETQCFILTGYAEFKYVQSAIHHGALDYLLKPITLEALRASLDCAAEKLLGAWKQTNLELNALVAGYFGSLSEQPIEDFSERTFHVPFDVTLVYASKQSNRPAMLRCLQQYENRMKALRSGHYTLCKPFADVELCLIAEKKDSDTDECLTSLKYALRTVGCSVFSSDVQNLRDVPLCASEIERHAILRLLAMPGETPPLHIPENQQLCMFCKSLHETTLALEEGNRFLFDGWIARLEGIQTYEFENRDYLRALKQHFEFLVPAKSISEIPSLLRQLGEKQFSSDHAKMDLPEAVKVYIDTNYHMDIGTNIIADTFNITPNYLSGIFKKKYQIGLLAYLTQVRMHKARLLIQKEPNIPIQKVAAAVGYSNAGYFSKVFQKTFGILPSDFR